MSDELAQALRQARDASGRSLRELERLVHVSNSSLSRYLNAQAVPPWPVVVALCQVAGQDPRPLRPLWERSRREARTAGAARATRPPLGSAPLGSAPPRNDLPLDADTFSGRRAELTALLDAARHARIVAIDGMAGVGKTTLAVHAAHRLAADHPDAQLYLDLHGFTPGREPVPPAEALRVLLTALGVAPARLPEDVEERAALWRAELAGRRAVVVLDNAADAGQVRPLLPGAGTSLVLLTSRRRLVELDGVRPVSLDVLDGRDAAELFAAAVGDDRAAPSPAVAEVLRRCGNLPLALRIAAARLRHRPAWTASTLLDRLRDGDLGMSAVFAMSLRQLDPAQRRMFRLLGEVPTADVDPYAAAALAGIPPGNARSLLDDLVDAHLLAEPVPDRYRQHDLLREHARAVAAAEETAGDRREALARLLDHYLSTAAAAIDLLYPDTAHLRPRVAAAPAVRLADAAGATAWLDAERANLIAAGSHAADLDWSVHTAALAATLYPYFDNQAHHADALVLYGKALTASRRHGDRAGEARALLDRGVMNWRQGRFEEADDHCRAALALAREAGDRYGQERALNGLGNVALRQRDLDRAFSCYDDALRLAREVGDPFGEAIVLGNLGLVRGLQDRGDEARAYLRDAERAYRAIGSLGGQGTVLGNRGVVDRREGRLDAAREHQRQALEVYRRLGYPSGEADALNALGEVALLAGAPAEALDRHRTALALALDAGNRAQLARAHDGLARAHHATGDDAAARTHATEALALYTASTSPDADDVREFLTTLDG